MTELQTPLAEALGQAHAALLEDLQRLEEAIDSTTGEGVSGLRVELGTVWRHLTEHFRFEEQNGYMDAIWEREPRLERAIQHLLDEHCQLEHSLDALIEKAWACDGRTGALGEQILVWITRVRQHETRENALATEAHHLDLGAEG